MNRVFLKSIICGFVVSLIFFTIAPLGLGILFIEILKPVLVPGIYVTQYILGNSVGILPVTLSLILNWVIITIPFAVFFIIRARKTGMS